MTLNKEFCYDIEIEASSLYICTQSLTGHYSLGNCGMLTFAYSRGNALSGKGVYGGTLASSNSVG